MSEGHVTFRLVEGVPSSAGRAIGFLEGAGELDASVEFSKLPANRSMYLLSSMSEWIGGINHPKTRFHGWPNDEECQMCFVFKVKEKRLGRRFYGFLCNPFAGNPKFQVCVLCVHALKKEQETDRSELLRGCLRSLVLSSRTSISYYGGHARVR